MASLTVLDNGDGTLTLSGTAVTDAGGGRYAIVPGAWVVDNGDGTLTLTSTADTVQRDLILTGYIEPNRWAGSIDPDEYTGSPSDQSPWTGYIEPSRWTGSITPDRYVGTLETG